MTQTGRAAARGPLDSSGPSIAAWAAPLQQASCPARRGQLASTAITDKARRFIECNFAERITLRRLERVTGCSSFAIMRAFRRRFGMTFHAFLTQTRISRAMVMLAKGEPAAETALAVGFVDQSHFIRHFKRALGTTPRRFVSTHGAIAGTGPLAARAPAQGAAAHGA